MEKEFEESKIEDFKEWRKQRLEIKNLVTYEALNDLKNHCKLAMETVYPDDDGWEDSGFEDEYLDREFYDIIEFLYKKLDYFLSVEILDRVKGLPKTLYDEIWSKLFNDHKEQK